MAKREAAESLIKYHTYSFEDKKLEIKEGVPHKFEPNEVFNVIVDNNRINRSQKISGRLREINNHLLLEGVFIGCVQTHQQMREARFIRKIPVLRSIYNFIEFVFHRIFPKMKGFKNVYYFLTGGKNRRVTKAEILGRLVCHGFELIDVVDDIDGRLYFVGKKIENVSVSQKSSYGPLYKMPRIGKDGKLIHVFKFRTMHPYSEHLQDYVLKQNGYSSTGKPANDFRLTSWGKVLRKYWIDEIPQLINVVRGDMKIMGVRPVSQRYFEDIPQRIQNLRYTQKPGCIPPYVAFNKKSAKDDVLAAEEMYLRLCKNKAAKVDGWLIYLAIKNILFKGMRSA